MTPPPHFAAPPADSSVRPGAASSTGSPTVADPLARVGAGAVSSYLSRLEAGRRELEAAGTVLATAGRAANADAMASAADRYEVATDVLRSLAAERTGLLTQSGAESIAALATSNPSLVSRVESLRESTRETRTQIWPRWVSARRSAVACAEVLDLIARGGAPSVTYAAGGAGEAAAGGALLNLSG